jgi:tRNA1Val (adenine37-N6)-methyltransferase
MEFQLKNFSVCQDHAPAKVGTDAILLGNWFHCTNRQKSLLDIGSGTGIIALLAADRFPHLKVHAMDPDDSSAIDSKQNFKRFPGKNKPYFFHFSLEEYMTTSYNKYDIIISNPPYLTEDIRSLRDSRHQWRHASQLPVKTLFDSTSKLLAPNGALHLIFPYAEWRNVTRQAVAFEFHLTKTCSVRSYRHSPPVRMMASFAREYKQTEEETLWIYESQGYYSEAYKNLCRKTCITENQPYSNDKIF